LINASYAVRSAVSATTGILVTFGLNAYNFGFMANNEAILGTTATHTNLLASFIPLPL